MLPDLKIPWRKVDPKNAEKLELELVREVGPQHVLFGKKARAIAVWQDCDDVLFTLESVPPSFAVVHLTWIMKTEVDARFPSAELYPTLDDWSRRCMVPDAEDWEASE